MPQLVDSDLSVKVYEKFRRLVYETAGISLGDAKRELVRSRLIKRLRHLGLESYDDYYRLVSEDATGEEIVRLVDAISTNKTDFFRESGHFDYLRDVVLPPVLEKGRRNGRHLRIWSAGCSSGEEPYTLAMVLREILGNELWDVRILATDISTKVLQIGQTGVYEEQKVTPVPPQLRRSYLEKEKTPRGAMYRVRPALREMVVFRRLNLMD
ncbi:chemotaxis protein CheR, partial [bacterium]|nr:chemotaxis protein CheR [bacterium]